jgi:hypothetical protein
MKKVWVLTLNNEIFGPVFGSKILADLALAKMQDVYWKIKELPLLETEEEVISNAS